MLAAAENARGDKGAGGDFEVGPELDICETVLGEVVPLTASAAINDSGPVIVGLPGAETGTDDGVVPRSIDCLRPMRKELKERTSD